MRYDVAIFDLDGTLTEPAEGITNSVAYALNKFGIKVEDKSSLLKFIGPPLKEAFMEYCGFDGQQAELALDYYREYFGTVGLFENRAYPGIRETLSRLKNAGVRMAVATSKPYEFSVEILKKYDLYSFFEFVGGATMDEKRTKKEEVVAYVLSNMPGIDPSRTVMVGDRKHDAEGGRANGIDCIGVLFGYGGEEELISAGALYIAATPQEVADIILG